MGRSKYAALGRFLAERRSESYVPMRFSEIERVLGVLLPHSKRYPAWWSNNPSNNPMTQIWLDAGFKTEQVDTVGERLVFANRAKSNRAQSNGEWDQAFRERGIDPDRLVEDLAQGMAEEARMYASPKPAQRHPAIGLLKGTFSIDPGVDLTKPVLDTDELVAWEAGLDEKTGPLGKIPGGKS